MKPTTSPGLGPLQGQTLSTTELENEWKRIISGPDDELDVCPRSQSLECTLATTGERALFLAPCKTWSCPYCSFRKRQQFYAQLIAGKPSRFLTLTLDRSHYATPRDAYQESSTQVSRLAQKLRRRYGEFEYVRVNEPHKSGYPHFHLGVRSPYIPWQVVRQDWHRLTRAKVTDIRKIEEPEAAARYLSKYLTKTEELGYTARRVSFSRGFLPRRQQELPYPSRLSDVHRLNVHPCQWLYRLGQDARVQIESIQLWVVKPTEEELDRQNEINALNAHIQEEIQARRGPDRN